MITVSSYVVVSKENTQHIPHIAEGNKKTVSECESFDQFEKAVSAENTKSHYCGRPDTLFSVWATLYCWKSNLSH